MNIFWQVTIIEALLNLAAFSAAVIAYGLLLEMAQRRRWTVSTGNVAAGLLAGCTTALSLEIPVHVAGGAEIGCQAVLVGLAFAFAGVRAGVPALLIPLTIELFEPGDRLIAVALALTALAGMFYRKLVSRRMRSSGKARYFELPVLSLFMGAADLLALALMEGWTAACAATIPSFATSWGVTMLIGTLLVHEHRRHKAEQKLRDLNAQLTAQTVELEKARDAAEHLSRAKSHFLASMSHELRTPLNAIIGFSDMIRTQIVGPVSDVYAGYAEDIYASGRHLLSLITDVLDFSKSEAGHLEISKDRVCLHRVIETALKMMRTKIDENQLVVRTSISQDDVISGDERRILQISLNLLSNAVKFSPRGGEIDIQGTMNRGDEVCLTIQDEGPGISAGKMAHIFEPFIQDDANLARANEGTGLGLPLTKRLVELHGGRLVLHGRSGGGTVATVTFPSPTGPGEPTNSPKRADAP